MSKQILGDLYRIEHLDNSHDRTGFCCGNDDLDHYFRTQASQDNKRNAATVFVLVENETNAIHGFYTLSAAQIQLDKLPPTIAKKLTRYKEQPAIRLGRLAIHKDQQGKKLGTFLLFEAMQRIMGQKDLGWVAFVVDAKDDNARNFYLAHDFQSFEDDKLHLYLMHSTIEKMFSPKK